MVGLSLAATVVLKTAPLGVCSPSPAPPCPWGPRTITESPHTIGVQPSGREGPHPCPVLGARFSPPPPEGPRGTGAVGGHGSVPQAGPPGEGRQGLIKLMAWKMVLMGEHTRSPVLGAGGTKKTAQEMSLQNPLIRRQLP